MDSIAKKPHNKMNGEQFAGYCNLFTVHRFLIYRLKAILLRGSPV